MLEDVYYNYSFYGDNENTNNDINDADNLTWTWSHSYSHRVDVTTGDVIRENSYHQWKNACYWNMSYANWTSTSTVLGIRGTNQSDQFDSSSNLDVGSKFFWRSRNLEYFWKLASLCLGNVRVIPKPRTQMSDVSVILMHLVDSMEKNFIVTCKLNFNFNIDLKMRFNLMIMTLASV